MERRRFTRDETRWQLLEKRQHISTLKLTAKHHAPVRIDAMDLKNRLRDIETNGRNRLHLAPPNHECPNSTHFDGASRAGGGAVHGVGCGHAEVHAPGPQWAKSRRRPLPRTSKIGVVSRTDPCISKFIKGHIMKRLTVIASVAFAFFLPNVTSSPATGRQLGVSGIGRNLCCTFSSSLSCSGDIILR